MTTNAPRIYPTLRYDDAAAAIRFLSDAFGFYIQDLTSGSDGGIDHALAAYDNGLVMVSSRRPGSSLFDHGTTCLYVAVDDPDGHHHRALAAGAEIVMELTDQPYGSREYAARDLEGQRLGVRHLSTCRRPACSSQMRRESEAHVGASACA